MGEKTLFENIVYYVVQRLTELATGPVWSDATAKYWERRDEPHAREAALAQRDAMQETFGADRVRAVRREEIVLECVIA